MKYVIHENYVPKGVVTVKGFVPKNSLPAPSGVRDVSEVVIVEIDGEKVVQLDPIKIAEYDNRLAQMEQQQQVADEKRKKLARLSFGMDIKADVMVLNEAKNWSQATWQSYMNNANIKALSALLVDGYLQTALNLLNTVDLSEFYDVSEVQIIANKIQSYINAE